MCNKKCLSKSKIEKNDIDEIVLGQVLTGGTGQILKASLDQISIAKGPAYIVNQVWDQV